MSGTLWEGTPYQLFAERVLLVPDTRLAYYLAQVDQTIAEVFGVTPDAEDAPPEARQVAVMMLRTLTGHDDAEVTTNAVAQLIDGWRKRRGTN